ncbi:MAG: zinc finger BED domain-containing protein [Planctomycetota bacterium]|jgi:hypothetical protein
MKLYYEAPDPNVLFYRQWDEKGRFKVATLESLVVYNENDWKAQFVIPGQAPVYMNQHDGMLESWEAVYAVTQDQVDDIVERIAQKVVAVLQDQGVTDPAEIVTKGMKVAMTTTVKEAVQEGSKAVQEEEAPEPPKEEPKSKKIMVSCEHCKQKFKGKQAEKNRIKHMKHNHPSEYEQYRKDTIANRRSA